MDRDYELLVEVVAAGSLSAAARKLRVSPAMVSKRLARLEARLGTRLVHRTTRHLGLTPAGERFHAEIVAILAALRTAEARVSEREGVVAGPLRISAPTSFGRLHIAPYLNGFLDLHPQVVIRLDLSDAFEDLDGSGIDLAIRIAPEIGRGLVAHRLATSRRILCAAPDYLARFGEPEALDDLARHRLLAAVGQLPWRLQGAEGQVAIDGQSFVQTNSSEVVRELALAGMGIALRSLWDIGRDLAAGRLERILGGYEGSSDVGIYAVHRRSGGTPANVAAFIAYIQALYSPHAPWEE